MKKNNAKFENNPIVDGTLHSTSSKLALAFKEIGKDAAKKNELRRILKNSSFIHSLEELVMAKQ